MIDRYFPKCPVDGPVKPAIPYGHLGARGAVPQKCGSCRHLFEGECTREMATHGYMVLDHGPCPVDGPTDPVVYEDEYVRSKVEIPRKCASCASLRIDGIRGFFCGRENETWGDFPRGLDWSTWSPEGPRVILPPSVRSSRELVNAAVRGDRRGFLILFRSLNPGVSLHEGDVVFEQARKHLEPKANPDG